MRVTPMRLAIAAFASVAVISGCAGQPKQEKNAEQGKATAAAPAQQTYHNDMEQYTLTYPASWNARVQPQDTNVWQGKALLDAENVVVFSYVEIDNGSQSKPLLALAAYDKATYDRLTSEVGTEMPSSQVVATHDNKVLVVYRSANNPYDPASFHGQQYARRQVGLDTLKAGLQW